VYKEEYIIERTRRRDVLLLIHVYRTSPAVGGTAFDRPQRQPSA